MFGIALGIATTRPVMGVFFATSRLTHLALHDFFEIAFWIGFTTTLIAAESWINNTRARLVCCTGTVFSPMGILASGWKTYSAERQPVGTGRGSIHHGCERLGAKTSVAPQNSGAGSRAGRTLTPDLSQRSLGVLSIPENSTKPVLGMQAAERPIAWTSDTRHIFTPTASATGLSIYKLDVDSGRRELWQVVKPKEQVGLRPTASPSAITPDGRWMAFTYGTQMGQLYHSDTLK